MEFAAPETVGALHNFFIPLIVLAVGGVTIFLARKSDSDEIFLISMMSVIAVVISFGAIIAINVDAGDKTRAQAIHAADGRVSMNTDVPKEDYQNGYRDTLPVEDNKLAKIQLIATDSLQTINCNVLLIEKTYRVSCDNPTGGDVKVSVDEALKVLDSRTPAN